MFFKRRTIKIKLFINYSLLFICIWLISDVFVYLYFSGDKQQQISVNQLQTCNAIQENINDQIDFIDSISLNIRSSQEVCRKFTSFVNALEKLPGEKRYPNPLLTSYAKECSDIVNQIVGINHEKYQVNLYDLRGNMIGSGMFNGYIPCNISDIPCFLPALQQKGKRSISGLNYLKWIPALSDAAAPKLSVSHSIQNKDGKTIGIVEVVQDCNVVFNSVKNFNDINVFVFNSDDECLYPYNTDQSLSIDEAKYYYYEIIIQKLLPLKINTINQYRRLDNKVLMTYSVNASTKFTTVVTQPKHTIYKALYNFNIFFIALAGVELIFTLIISFALASKITRPLRNLRHAIRRVKLDQITNSFSNPINLKDAGIEEIDDLSDSFLSMYNKLGKSLFELITIKSEEANSKILAIQAQMNPHFLYNNIANISAMAEAGMDKEIIAVCEDISYMLRYIARENRIGVALETEMEYTARYFKCIKIKYGNNIQLDIDIPEAMKKIVIPKLTIQPLLENAVKYGLSTDQPWHLSIRGDVTDNLWRIKVSDTGLGINPEILQGIEAGMENFNRTEKFPELQIHGMGLLNIYIRLKMLYKDNAVFHIENLKGRGCAVTIGGITDTLPG